jgi:hypothetical protein
LDYRSNPHRFRLSPKQALYTCGTAYRTALLYADQAAFMVKAGFSILNALETIMVSSAANA